jgi:phosphoserine phosphatase
MTATPAGTTPTVTESVRTVLATLTGPDRPGLNALLLGSIADSGAEVLDFEQVVVRGEMSLAFLLGSVSSRAADMIDHLAGTAARLGLAVRVEEGIGDNPPRPNRAIVTVLGRPLLAGHIAAVARIIADHGGNVTGVHHDRGRTENINECILRIDLETRNYEHIEEILNALRSAGIKVTLG